MMDEVKPERNIPIEIMNGSLPLSLWKVHLRPDSTPAINAVVLCFTDLCHPKSNPLSRTGPLKEVSIGVRQ